MLATRLLELAPIPRMEKLALTVDGLHPISLSVVLLFEEVYFRCPKCGRVRWDSEGVVRSLGDESSNFQRQLRIPCNPQRIKVTDPKAKIQNAVRERFSDLRSLLNLTNVSFYQGNLAPLSNSGCLSFRSLSISGTFRLSFLSLLTLLSSTFISSCTYASKSSSPQLLENSQKHTPHQCDSQNPYN